MATYKDPPKRTRVATPEDMDDLNSGKKTLDDFYREGSQNGQNGHAGQQKPQNRPGSEAFVTVGSASNRLEFEPFPVDALPAPIKRFVRVASGAIGCDPSFIAVPMLVVCAACIGNSRVIRLKYGWTEPAIIWGCVIANSGDHKSPALAVCLGAIRQLQQRKLREYEKAIAQFNDCVLAEYESKLAEYKRSKLPGKQPPEKPVEPVAWRIVADDLTLEALADLLRKQPRGLLVAVDELAAWLGSMERYKKGSDLARWLEVFGARPLVIDRKTGNQKTIYIPRAAVSICGGIQPDAYKRLMTLENRSNGMSARLLSFMPPRRPRKWTDKSIEEKDEAIIEELIDRLLRLEMEPPKTINDDPTPAAVSMSVDAKKIFVSFYNQHAEEQSTEASELAATWSKLEGYVPRIALTLHCIRWAAGEIHTDDEFLVDAESMQSAITLVKWFANEARRVHSMLAESPEEQATRELVDWIQQRGGSVTAREMQAHLRKYRSSAARAEADLRALVLAKLGKMEVEQTGGRPSLRFVLNNTECQRLQKPEIVEDSDPFVDGLPPQFASDADIAAIKFPSDKVRA